MYFIAVAAILLSFYFVLGGIGGWLALEPRPNFYVHFFIPVVAYFADILRSLFPWPAILLFALWLVLRDRDFFSRIVSSLESLEYGSFGIKIRGSDTGDAFERGLDRTDRKVDRISAEIEQLYFHAKQYASVLRQTHDIDKGLSDLAIEIGKIAVAEDGKAAPDFRLTVHIPDIVSADQLFQFTEYFGPDGRPTSTGKVGRTLSVRYGVIGRAWRSGIPELAGDVISSEDRDYMRMIGLHPVRLTAS